MTWCKVTDLIIFLLTIIMVDKIIVGTHLKKNIILEKRDYTPSKWVANSAMDVWYGNKSMIDIMSRELSDLMYKLTARASEYQLLYSIYSIHAKITFIVSILVGF